MLSHPAALTYRGLTIIMSNPSRFDKTMLLSGNAGCWFCDDLLKKVCGMTRFNCDILDVESYRKNPKLRDGTKVVLLLGQSAQDLFTRKDYSLGEMRGSPWVIDGGIVCVSSFLPQDCFDMVDHESRLNPELAEQSSGGDDDDETGDTTLADKSRHGKTKRGNYRFWLRADMMKISRILQTGLRLPPTPKYHIYPNLSVVIEALTAAANSNNEDFYFDIETDSDRNMLCFGFMVGEANDVYVVPLIRHDYSLAYGNIGSILLLLHKAISKNVCVAHNGSSFDYLVLPWKYGIGFGNRRYDTMLAAHRCHVQVEKSLGHVISLFTDLPYHKDEGVFEPKNNEQEQSLWEYNGKDVFALREVKRGIEAYAETVPGLKDSIQQAMDSINPYVMAMLQGMALNEEIVAETLKTNDRILNGILKLLNAAIGEGNLESIRGTGKSVMPSSSSQCCRYFHDWLGYPVMGYGKVKKDGTRAPSLNEGNFLKLVMKLADKGVKNPVIDLVLGYRGVAKESSMLEFERWNGVKRLK